MEKGDIVKDLQCNVKLELLVGQDVKRLAAIPGPRRRGLGGLCRGGVGSGYLTSLMGKSVAAFALVATDPVKGTLTGFAKCKLYNSFAGGKTRSQVPVTERIVMLDLICTGKECGGLGSALINALKDISRSTFGATLLMLEATRGAAGLYAYHGFKREPNACDPASASRQLVARRAFEQRVWKNYETEGPRSFKNAAAGKWWAHYNRGENGTVIMSFCLKNRAATPGRGRAIWTDRSAATLMAENARGKNYANIAESRAQLVDVRRYAIIKAAAGNVGTPPPVANKPAAGPRRSQRKR